MSTISVRTHFAAGHRILGLTGPGAKCRNIHGHTFHVTWTYAQDVGDPLEFGAVKEKLRAMIATLFDHGFIIDREDEFIGYLRAGKLKYYALIGPPTTEAIAAEIAKHSRRALPKAPLLSVELREGPDNTATWFPTLEPNSGPLHVVLTGAAT